MTRYRALYDHQGLLAEYENDTLVYLRPGAANQEVATGPQIIGDLKPYRSMIDGSIIVGRKRHRDHLKAHNCVEIGNDVSHMKREPIPIPSSKKLLHQLLGDVSERELQNMIKRDIRNNRK
jgi:hypothetical protein